MRGGVERRTSRSRLTAGLLSAVAWGSSAGVAAAAPVTVGWTTYLRSGPDYASPALTELEHDTRVDLKSCDGRWCRVSATGAQGFIDRDALSLPRTLAPVPPARTGCVVAGQADNRGPIPTRFCSAQPVGR